MSYTKEREEFIAHVTAEGLPISVIRQILAKANTLQKIAELSCSSEAADRDRVPCPAVKSGKDEDCCCDFSYQNKHIDVPRIDRQEMRIKRQLEKLIAGRKGFNLHFQGDPRGAVVKLAVPSGKYDDCSREGLCVPARGLPVSYWDRR